MAIELAMSVIRIAAETAGEAGLEQVE